MKRPPFRKVAIYGSGILVALGLLGAGVIAFENYRGKRAWEDYRQEAEARGVKFDLKDYVPPLILDAENFAATPLFRGLFEGDKQTRDAFSEALRERLSLKPAKEGDLKPPESWRLGQKLNRHAWAKYLGEPNLQIALQKFEPDLAEIASVAGRPSARFPLEYSEGSMMALPHLSPAIHLANLFKLRAVARLDARETDQALADTQLIFRLDEAAMDNNGLAITMLVHISVVAIALQPIWEGIATHQWNEDQLRSLQERLHSMDLLAMSRRALERERLACALTGEMMVENKELFDKANEFMALFDGANRYSATFKLFPRKAICYQSLILTDRLFEIYLLPLIDEEAHRVHCEKSGDLSDLIVKYGSQLQPYTMSSERAHSALSSVALKVAEVQASIDHAAIACALERHRIERGVFPAKLEALVPQYLAKLRHDVITGEPLRYQLTEDGGYLLYSVGRDGIDDGGLIAAKENGSVDSNEGDWVWKMPGATKEINREAETSNLP